MSTPLEQKALLALRQYSLFTQGDRIAVGVSGGADSVALLRFLAVLREEYRWELIVCHIHHGLRGAEADRDEQFVGELARQLGLPYAVRHIDAAALALENLQGIFTTLWQNVLQPILTNLMQLLSTIWSSHLKPLWDDILLLVASVANCLLDLWNNLLAPVAKWIIATFGPAFAEVFNAIADVVGVAVGAIADAIDLAVVVLRGLADFLSAVFRGNWDAAWQAIGNTVSTVWDKMTNAIKTAVNGIIGFINRMISAVVTGINTVINALNGLSFDLPDIFGGGHVGFHISTLTAPQIPYLAQGAVIPANREFLAVLGDQSHGTNVEAPLDTIKQAVAEVLEDLQAGQMAGFEAVVSVLREILSAVYGIELTDEDVGHAVQRWQRKQLTATGGV